MDLKVIFYKNLKNDFSSKICTYRPSLSLQSGISRNIVDVLESVSRRQIKALKKRFIYIKEIVLIDIV